MNHLDLKPWVTDPELEVHSEERKEAYEVVLKERNEELSSLREVVKRQGLALAHLRQPQQLEPKVSRDASVSFDENSITADSKSKHSRSFSMELGYVGWSEDEDSQALEGIDRGMIRTLREEASRVDTVLALSQRDTMKQEIHSLKREVGQKTAELEELRALVQVQKDRVATLELERDLYKADTNRMEADLMSANGSVVSVGTASRSTVSTPHQSQPSTTSVSTDRSRPSMLLFPVQERAKGVEQARLQESMLEEVSISSSIVACRDTTDPVDFLPRELYVHSTPPRPPSYRRHPVPRRRSFQSSVTPSSSIEMTGISLQAEVSETNERYFASMQASNELRKRLAMISRYYERIIQQLQENMSKMKTDRVRREVDYSRQVASIDLDKQHAVDELAAQLQEKDKEIERLREQLRAEI